MVNVLFLGVVKNVEQTQIKNNITNIFYLCNKFNKSKLIIYENNSTDNTKNILKNISDDRFVFLSEDITYEDIKKQSKAWAYTKITGSDHPCRIEQISNARNKVINEINKKEYDDYDVVIWIDMDLQNLNLGNLPQYVEEVKNNEKIVLTGNSEPYYDYYALRINQEIQNGYINRLLGPEIIGEPFWYYLSRNNIVFKERINVLSAFNGVGIYNKKVFKKYNYNFLVDDYVEKYYINILNQNKNLMKYMNFITNDCNKFPGGRQDKRNGIIWKNNAGYDKPIICEHVNLHAKLKLDNYNIYIEPNLMITR